ncbi:MAG: hypothetical protein ACK5LC_08955, partial [Coprobacillaceae bacterium]
IPVNEEKYKEAGTYNVDYKVVDQWGNEGTASVTIKVHGLPVISANFQEYFIDDSTILSGVGGNPTASWMQASDIVGEVPTFIDILGPANDIGGNNTIMYEITSGPSTDFSKLGIYNVTYTAINPDGRSSEKTISVVINARGITTDPTDTLSISANGFVVEAGQNHNLTTAIVKDSTHGNAFAYKTVKDADGNIIEYTDITDNITVNENQLQQIINASEKGGIFDLTFEVKEGNKSVSKIVKVIVKGSSVMVDGDTNLIVTANDFTISYQEAKTLDEAEAIVKATAQAVLLNDEELSRSAVLKISANSEQLSEINSVGINGSSFDLTFTASYINQEGKETSVSVSVVVTVNGKSDVTSNGVGTGDNTSILIYGIALCLSTMYLIKKNIRSRT